MTANLQPFSMLVEHGINDVHESFVAGKETMASREEVSFEHSLKRVLTQHFDHAAVRRNLTAVAVLGEEFLDPEFLRGLVNRVQPIGGGLIRPKHSKVLHIKLHHIAQKDPKRFSISSLDLPGLLHSLRVVAKIGKP